jgi:large subunit ribosomal protein L2
MITIWRYKSVKKLTLRITRGNGRNNQGRISVWHRSGVVRRLRHIDFRRRLHLPAIILRLERDPTRSAPIALIVYSDGTLSYILAAENLGTMLDPQLSLGFRPGVAATLKDIPIGTAVHNIELKPGFGGTIARSAGNKAQIVRKIPGFALLRLASGELHMFHNTSYATVGVIQQNLIFVRKLTKAGQARWLGRRPVVRGVAMNPIDHPHGGGEGKTSGGRPSCSPWGILTKGWRTRKARKQFTHIYASRHKHRKN